MSDVRLSGMKVRKHWFDLPLDYQERDGETIKVFARELVALDKSDHELPWLVFLQGGPGFGAARPVTNSGWMKRALKEYRVLLLDQRGTGLSSPVSFKTLGHLSGEKQAEYLAHFRADNIVRDAEQIREALCPDSKWSVLGQSFGGFCMVHYLSAAPEGLKEAFVTGGLPSIELGPDEVYEATFKTLIRKSQSFFNRYPDAVDLITALISRIEASPVELPSGKLLTQEIVQTLGMEIGRGHGFETLYYLLEQAVIDTANGPEVNPVFLRYCENSLSLNTNPIYALLHEPIYCQGAASNWSAQRVLDDLPDELMNSVPFLFTGEMIFPWMFDQFSNLAPLKDCAHYLAQKSDWPALYDRDQLNKNEVPVAAIIYSDDLFVEQSYSIETARQIGNLKFWLTSEYEHDGIHQDGEKILSRLIEMSRED